MPAVRRARGGGRCVALLLVCGEAFFPAASLLQQPVWFKAYCELLDRSQLWCERTEIIQRSTIKDVRELNAEAAMMIIACGACSAELAPGAYCAKACKAFTGICALCRLPTRGLYAWCHGCGHGGHAAHMRLWFATEAQCPAGCGHQCVLVDA